MSNLIEIKNLFDKELKKFKKIIKTVTDKYKEISEEHELLLADVEALDTRLIFVEKKLKISNDFDIYNNSTNNIKDLSEFRYQIIGVFIMHLCCIIIVCILILLRYKSYMIQCCEHCTVFHVI